MVSRRVGSVSEMALPPSGDRRRLGGALAVLTGHAEDEHHPADCRDSRPTVAVGPGAFPHDAA